MNIILVRIVIKLYIFFYRERKINTMRRNIEKRKGEIVAIPVKGVNTLAKTDIVIEAVKGAKNDMMTTESIKRVIRNVKNQNQYIEKSFGIQMMIIQTT